jgi:hypothetical protein
MNYFTAGGAVDSLVFLTSLETFDGNEYLSTGSVEPIIGDFQALHYLD